MWWGGAGRKIVWIVVLPVGCVVVIGVLAQLFGPAIAARVVRDKVSKYGTVDSVHVSAWPALKLLWRHADEVTVHAKRLRLRPEQTVTLLREATGTDRVSASADSVEEDGLQLTDTRFLKHGGVLRAEGAISAADVARALPAGVQVTLLGSSDGAVQVRVSGDLFGVSASVDAIAQAENGKLVARPTALLLSGLRLTLLENPHLYVRGVSARALAPGPEGGARYELAIWASLR